MELDTVDRLGVVSDGCKLGVPGSRNGVETLGQLGELVTVRHPHLHAALQALEQPVDVSIDALGRQLGGTVLPVDTGHDVVAVHTVSQLLLTVANTQDWDIQVEEGWVAMGSVRVVDGVGATTEDETDGLELELGQLCGTWEHFRVDIELAKTADDAGFHYMSVTALRHLDSNNFPLRLQTAGSSKDGLP